jgi:phosphoribosylformylglycinamidine cyclo-ligase
VTGGGFEGNLARPLGEGVGVRLRADAWEPPPLFAFLAREGNIPRSEMVRVFNMGIGFCLYVEEREVDRVSRSCAEVGTPAIVIGGVVAEEGVSWA